MVGPGPDGTVRPRGADCVTKVPEDREDTVNYLSVMHELGDICTHVEGSIVVDGVLGPTALQNRRTIVLCSCHARDMDVA